MGTRSPWVAVLLAGGCGAVVVLCLTVGAWGVGDLFLLLLLLAGLVGPVLAAVHLGATAQSSRPFRRNLLALLAGPAVASVLAGWLGHGGAVHSIAVVMVFMGVAVLSVGALLSSAVARGGREEFEGVARSLWTLALAGAVFCLSLPVGWVFQAHATGRAKTWVEAAAVEVRAVERSTGRLPADLREILARVGPPPRPTVPPDGGYVPSGETGDFEFRIQDPDAFIFGWWIHDGRTGAWRSVSD